MSSWLGMDSVLSFKLISFGTIFVLALGASFLPSKVRNANVRALSVANTFGGGVFLAAGLCHLLAEAHEGMEAFYEFPMAYTLAGIGFMLTLCIEEFVHWYSSHKSTVDDNHIHVNEGLLNAGDAVMNFPEDHDHHGHSHGDNHGHSHASGLIENDGSIVSAMVLWIALAFHSIMEGLALGADEEANKSIFIAILAHKGIESFALGTSLLRSSMAYTTKYYLCLVGFSLMTPIGILAGIALERTFESELASLYVSSIAAGTFIYVSIVEVILNEFKRPQDKLVKVFALAVGFGFMAILAKWT